MVIIPQLRIWLAKRPAVLTSPPALVAAILALAYLPLAYGRALFNRDLLRFIHPIRWFARDSLARGDAPWWTPHIGLGHSMLADPQSALFYPVNLLHQIGPLPLVVMLVMFLHLVWGAVGMARVASAFHLAKLPAVAAGVAWALSGYVASLWTNGARLPSAAWISWQIWALVNLARAADERQGTLRAVAWLAVVSAAGILAGDVFVALMGGMVGFGLAAAWLLGEGHSRARSAPETNAARAAGGRVRLRFLGACALAAAVAALLSMVTLLPAALAVADTERIGGVAVGLAQAGSLHPARIAEFAAPEAFARAWHLAPNDPWVASYLDGAPLSLNTYLGGAVLALLPLAFVPLRKRIAGESQGVHRVVARASLALVAAVALLFVLVALGRHTPVHGVLRAMLAPLAYMRAPEKFLLAVVPCVALLAAAGADRLMHAPTSVSWKWGLLVPVLLLTLAYLAPTLFAPGLGAQVQKGAWRASLAALVVLAGWPLAHRSAALAGCYLVSAIAVDLALAQTLTLRFQDGSSLQPPPLARMIQPSARPSLPFPRLFRGSKVQLTAAGASDADSDRITMETLRDNISVPFGVDILPGYGVAIPPDFTRILEYARLDALRLLATDFALLSAPDPTAAIPDGLSLVSTPLPGVRLYRVAHALPRTFVTFNTQKRPASDVARHVLDQEVTSGAVALLEESEPWVGPQRAEQSAVPCQLDRFRNTLVQATCDSPFPGLAIFVEQHARGWTATVDGAPERLLKANAVMRAVPIPAGRHTVTVSYQPPGLSQGAMASLLGLLVTLVLFLAGRSRKTPHESTPPGRAA